MERNDLNKNPQETRGWEIVKLLNANVPQCGNIEARKLLAEYFKLGTGRPSRLHSAILSCAVKMAMAFPEFHFVPFLEMWGLENLRPEDSEAKIEDGKRYPSLVEKMTKAYAYSLLFHPGEHLECEFEQIMKPVLRQKGYRLEDKDGQLSMISQVLVTRVFLSEVKGRKMIFATLLTPWGEEIVTEVHTMTQFANMRYEELTNRLFRVVLRSSENDKLRVEAACLSNEKIEDCFATAIGYVEHIDANHHHIHVYDNQSRHFVATYLTTDITEGQYVQFVPVIPKESNFKAAIICNVVNQGAEAFGYRDVVVTFANEEQGFCAWELLPNEEGKVTPIMETGAKADVGPATKGYISKETVIKVLSVEHALCESQQAGASKVHDVSKGFKLPKKGDHLQIITFLKRGKDGNKKPFVVDYIQSPSNS